MQVHVLSTLRDHGFCRHFATIFDSGQTSVCNYIVMTLLGKSLEELKTNMGNRFSLSTTLRLGLACLEALQDMHNIGFLHRDVKPANFAIGRGTVSELRRLYVLDFGMCRPFIRCVLCLSHVRTYLQQTHGRNSYAACRHLLPWHCALRFTQLPLVARAFPTRRSRELVLPTRKCAQNTCALLYVQVEFTTGTLPWGHLCSMATFETVGKIKDEVRKPEYQKVSYARDCWARGCVQKLLAGCPRVYIQVYAVINAIRYYDKPPYMQLYSLLRNDLHTRGYHEADPFDW
jgi:tau tubulin kinase